MNSQEKTYDIFVYGSLKKGFPAHSFLEGSEFLGKALTVDKYLLSSSSYPMLSRKQPLCQVKGECYRINEETLARLDEYEGYPEEYDRIIIKVQIEGEKDIKEVWAYIKEDAVGETIHEDGEYTR